MPEAEAVVLMMVDPQTKEAYRMGGTDPKTSGPLFFTSRQAMEEYARREGISGFEAHEVPAGVLSRMKGKPHWVDGNRGG